MPVLELGQASARFSNLLPGQHGEFQSAETGDFFRIAENFDGENTEIRAAGESKAINENLPNPDNAAHCSVCRYNELLQWQAATTKLKLDLYDRHFKIYQSVADVCLIIFKAELNEIEPLMSRFVLSTREALFLFDQRDGIDKTLQEIRVMFNHIINLEVARKQLPEKSRETLEIFAQKHIEAAQALLPKIDELEKKLRKYLMFSSVTGWRWR